MPNILLYVIISFIEPFRLFADFDIINNAVKKLFFHSS